MVLTGRIYTKINRNAFKSQQKMKKAHLLMDTVFRIIPEGIAIYDTEKDEVVLENPAFSERVLANAKL